MLLWKNSIRNAHARIVAVSFMVIAKNVPKTTTAKVCTASSHRGGKKSTIYYAKSSS
jgi:hypothetical protein